MNRIRSRWSGEGWPARPVAPVIARGGAVALLAVALLAVALAACGATAEPAGGPPAAAGPTSEAPAVPGPTTAAASGTSTGTPTVTPVTSPAPGNGPAADRAAAETVFRTYLRAVADGDFATACSLNAPETNQRLLDELARRGTPAATCEQAIATLYAGSGVAQGAATIANTLQIQRVDVNGDAATVAW